jgi:hypothetical protein
MGQTAPVKSEYDVCGMTRIRAIINDLSDSPSEALVVALADAVFELESSTEKRFAYCVSEADEIRSRLRAHGFDVVLTDRAYRLDDSQH